MWVEIVNYSNCTDDVHEFLDIVITVVELLTLFEEPEDGGVNFWRSHQVLACSKLSTLLRSSSFIL